MQKICNIMIMDTLNMPKICQNNPKNIMLQFMMLEVDNNLVSCQWT